MANEFNPDDYTPEELAYMAAQYDAEHPEERSESTANQPMVNRVVDALLSKPSGVDVVDVTTTYDPALDNQILPTAEEQGFDQLVGKNVGYYRRVRSDLENGTSTVKLNASAFFLTSAWFAYRKMYAHAAVFAVLEFLIAAVAAFQSGTTLVAVLISGIASALLANSAYIKTLDKRTQQYSTLHSEDERRTFVRKHGGTNIGIAIFLGLLVKILPAVLPILWTMIIVWGLLTGASWVEATDAYGLLLLIKGTLGV